MENKQIIGIEDFKKLEIKIGHILSAENVPDSEKLLRLSVDFGEEKPRQIISGIAKYFNSPEEVVGKRCAFATNLEPRTIMGLESQGMVLAVSGEGYFSALETNSDVPPGATVK
jgi:methionine--tRNA ligase beta chain